MDTIEIQYGNTIVTSNGNQLELQHASLCLTVSLVAFLCMSFGSFYCEGVLLLSPLILILCRGQTEKRKIAILKKYIAVAAISL